MMKTLLFAFGILCIPALVNAQQANNEKPLSGEVVYRETQKMDIQLEGIDAQIAEQIPRERKSEKVLRFTEEEAVFENREKEDLDDDLDTEGSGIMIRVSQPDNKTYWDLKKGKVIEQKEFMSRFFLIESELEPTKWKMSGKQKMILDYACQEAVTQMEGTDIRAWFTPEIGVPVGPGTFSGLPGLVLAVEMNEGDRRIEAIGVDMKPLEKSELKEPTRGKKVSPDEFQAIVAEKLKEMGMEGDGTWHSDGGSAGTSTVVIRIEQ